MLGAQEEGVKDESQIYGFGYWVSGIIIPQDRECRREAYRANSQNALGSGHGHISCLWHPRGASRSSGCSSGIQGGPQLMCGAGATGLKGIVEAMYVSLY